MAAPNAAKNTAITRSATRHLVMFDLDGTLLESGALDVHCFSGALKSVLGVEGINGDWGAFRYVTDVGIVAEIAAGRLRRPATRDELAAIKAGVLELLRQQTVTSPEEFAPIPGAPALLEGLARERGCGVAIATGCWRESARIKLATAGFDLDRYPLASCDDSHRREEIMQAAHQRARTRFGVSAFETVTYVGDGVWDLRASRSLGYHFIGIGRGDAGGALRREGAGCVLADFDDREAFLARLDEIWNRQPKR